MYKEIKNKLKEMYEAQLELNTFIKPNWRRELNMFNFESAILVEAGEALESANYKWWKKQEKDVENTKIELIDVLHFKLSWLYYVDEEIKEKEINNFVHGLQINPKCEDVMLLTNLGRRQSMYDLAVCFNCYNMDFNEVYRTYMIKYTLNKFRKDNGYQDGTYIKNWNGYEDNVVAVDLANKLEDTDNFKENLYELLETYYKKVKNETDNQSNSAIATDSPNN